MTKFCYDNGVITRHDNELVQPINIDELIDYVNNKERSIESLSIRAETLYNFKGRNNVTKM